MSYPKVFLKEDKEGAILRGHHWVFSGAISKAFDPKPGEIVALYSFANSFIGYGYFNPSTSISIRMVSLKEEDPLITIRNNLKKAIDLREKLYDKSKTNCYRLVHAESDFLPGLIIDRFDSVLILQIATLGMEKLKPFIIQNLIELLPIRSIYEKSTASSRKLEGLSSFEGLLFGEKMEEVKVLEEGIPFVVDITEGQKTGFFLDQKRARKAIFELAKDKKVLDAFSYSGAFSLYALLGEAFHVDLVDSSKRALDFAKKNFLESNIDESKFSLHEEDFFSFLEKKEFHWDLVILDPPAFAKKASDIPQALKAYKRLNQEVMKKMKEGGLLLTCSCSHFVKKEDFLNVLIQAAKESKKKIKVLSSSFESYDHPFNPLHKETFYLKNYLLFLS